MLLKFFPYPKHADQFVVSEPKSNGSAYKAYQQISLSDLYCMNQS